MVFLVLPQFGMAVSGYPNMENIPPAQNYTAPPRVAVPPLYHHKPQQQQQQQRPQQQQQQMAAVSSLSPNYPPPRQPLWNRNYFLRFRFRQVTVPVPAPYLDHKKQILGKKILEIFLPFYILSCFTRKKFINFNKFIVKWE
jgi:hypothetical protein